MVLPIALQEGSERELLQQQLQEANRRAQEYRHQLLRKEQEAEQYRLRLEAMARQQPNGVDFTVVEEVAEVDAVVMTEGDEVERTAQVMKSKDHGASHQHFHGNCFILTPRPQRVLAHLILCKKKVQTTSTVYA